MLCPIPLNYWLHISLTYISVKPHSNDSFFVQMFTFLLNVRVWRLNVYWWVDWQSLISVYECFRYIFCKASDMFQCPANFWKCWVLFFGVFNLDQAAGSRTNTTNKQTNSKHDGEQDIQSSWTEERILCEIHNRAERNMALWEMTGCAQESQTDYIRKSCL